MADAKRTATPRTFVVLVSFDGLDEGERFTQEPSDWAARHVETGYLRDVTGEPTVEVAQNAGPVSQG